MTESQLSTAAPIEHEALSPSDAAAIEFIPAASAFAPHSRQQERWRWTVLLVVFTVSALYQGHLLKRGWVPHDDGSFAHTAERVLAGQLPHRDFDDLYTGGLNYLHALAFRVAGVNLAAMRFALYFFFLLWVPAVFFIATRFASALAAGAITLLAVAWSLPNYSAPVPSWYNLFLATFGIAFLFRYLEANSRWLLAFAGICGGLSVLVKISGLYYVAGVLLFVLFREQRLSSRRPISEHRLYRWTIIPALLLFIGLLAGLIRNNSGLAQAAYFFLPGAVLSVLLILHEVEIRSGSDAERFSNLFGMLLPFTAGVTAPIILFLVPYVLSRSLPVLLNGVFIVPTRRLLWAAMAPPPISSLLAVVPFAALVFVTLYLPKVFGWLTTAAAALGMAVILIGSARDMGMYWLAWRSAYTLLPVAVVIGAAILFKRSPKATTLHDERVMLLLSVTAICALVQFPFSAPIYFCYIAPLVVLCALAIGSYSKNFPKLLAISLMLFYCLFAVMRTTPGFIYSMGVFYVPDYETRVLSLSRAGGIRVHPDEAAEFEHVIPLLQKHSHGDFLYAAPDCPELYFLSGLKNPTRTLVDFLDDPSNRTQRILDSIDQHAINVIAINNHPEFSPWIDAHLRAALVERFPNYEKVGRFQVRWR